MVRKICGLIGFALLVGCQPKPDIGALTKYTVVQTDYNASALSVFHNYSTYTMLLDSIGYYDNSDPNSADTLATGTSVNEINAKIRFKMDSLGYKWVSKNSSPDFLVYPYIQYNYSEYTSYSPYNYGYYGYGYGYYGGYGGYSVNVTETGDFYIYIIDLKSKTSGPYLWACDIWDLVSYQDPTAPILQAVNQAFKQSPYLKK